MKSFLKSLTRQGGFTLVELMVVVAIIGLLSAVAVPNFKKYQSKAKVSEAKLQLSALYTAQSAFFSDYNMYAGCLRYMGFDPQPEMASRYYAIGFFEAVAAIDGNAHASAVNSGMNGTDCPIAVAANGRDTTVAGTSYYFAGKGVGAVIANVLADIQGASVSMTDTQADANSMIFDATAVGVISGDAATVALGSLLNINQAKVITNTRNGY